MADETRDVARIEHVSVDVGHPSVRVLHDVSIDVSTAAHVVVLGRNGSGKTTLLLALAGIVPIATGHVHLPQPVALLVQDPGAAWFATTVADEVGFALRNTDVSPARARARVSRVLAAVGATALRDRHPATLSGGEQQRVQLAAVLATRPRTLLVDEPTAHLDDDTAGLLDGAIRAGEFAPATVIRTSPDAARSLDADRVVVLDRGRVVAEGVPDDVWTRDVGLTPPALVHAVRVYAAQGVLSPPLPSTWAALSERVGP